MNQIMASNYEYQQYSGKKYIETTNSKLYDIREDQYAQEIYNIFPLGACIKINSIQLWNALDVVSKRYAYNHEDYIKCNQAFDKKLIDIIKRYIIENPNELYRHPDNYNRNTEYISFTIDKYGDKKDPENIDFIIMSR